MENFISITVRNKKIVVHWLGKLLESTDHRVNEVIIRDDGLIINSNTGFSLFKSYGQLLGVDTELTLVAIDISFDVFLVVATATGQKTGQEVDAKSEYWSGYSSEV